MGIGKKNTLFIFGITFFLLVMTNISTLATSFGRNKVQYENFEWYYITTPHFTVYHTSEFQYLAEIAEGVLEQKLKEIQDDLGYKVKQPIPIIIYPSPNSFLETNVTLQILTEGIGGFTELFKNRIVIPFNGSYKDFKHVLEHELTHAVSFDMIYGRSPGTLLSTASFFNMPLWFAEGLSEYESIGWDYESDMYIRDALFNDRIAPPDMLGGFFLYKEGQSIVRFIANKYGGQKLGEIIGKGKVHVSMDKALEASLGIDTHELYKEWLTYIQKTYYPEIKNRDLVDEIATQITFHKKDGSYFNTQPVYSPAGAKVAFFSDKDDYVSLYIKDILKDEVRRLIKGARSSEDEQLHPFTSSITWSPDGKDIAYVSRSKGKDVINIVDVKSGDKIKVVDLKSIKSITNPAWSNDGTRIAFAGLQDDRRDVYIYNLDYSNFQRLTSDIYDDIEPAWSLNDQTIAFASDGPEDTTQSYTCGDYNIYTIDVATGERRLIVDSDAEDITPQWSPLEERRLCFISTRQGVYNIYTIEVDSLTTHPVTNLLTGCRNLTWSPDGKYLISSILSEGAWDLFKFRFKQLEEEVPKTPFALEEEQNHPEANSSDESGDKVDMSSYVFTSADNFASNTDDSLLASSGRKKYKPKFSADLVSVLFGYSSYYGLQGQTVLLLSDIMGNHQILLATDVSGDIEESNIFTFYQYLRYQIDYGASAFYYKNYFLDNEGRIFSDKQYGLTGLVSYPLSQFTRFQLSCEAFFIDRHFLALPLDACKDDYSVRSGLGRLSWITDNTLWGMTGPVKGHRYNASVEAVAGFSNQSPQYIAAELDLRQYIKFFDIYNLSFRLSAGGAFGNNPKEYYAGGVTNWLNYNVKLRDIYSPKDIYFSKFVVPLRGYDYFHFIGQQYILSNNEFRFIFIKSLDLGFPPVSFRYINGSVFFDACLVGDHLTNARFFKNGALESIKAGTGISTKIWLAGFLLSWDVAWRTDLKQINTRPIHYFKLGADF